MERAVSGNCGSQYSFTQRRPCSKRVFSVWEKDQRGGDEEHLEAEKTHEQWLIGMNRPACYRNSQRAGCAGSRTGGGGVEEGGGQKDQTLEGRS